LAGQFVRVASAGDVGSGKLLVVQVNGQPVCLARAAGTVVALSATCTHDGCDLAEYGEIDGGELECICHGSRFELATGNVVQGPASDPLPRYEVRTEGNEVFVSVP
jgi:nitrite reductase/ring-hydroxylating ferredoxin subunit